MVLFVTPTAVELSVCRGEGGCGQRISINVWQKGTIFLAMMNMAVSSALVVEDITSLMISEMVKRGR